MTMCYVEVMRAKLTQTDFSDSPYLLSCFYLACLTHGLTKIMKHEQLCIHPKRKKTISRAIIDLEVCLQVQLMRDEFLKIALY